MTYRECYQYGMVSLQNADIADAKLDARLLLEYVCGTSYNDLILHGDKKVSQSDSSRYQILLEKRAQRIPLQHITGSQEFMGYTFSVNEHVLIPRQDTEILVEEALQLLKPDMQILDMCTGSGCILLSLLAFSTDTVGVGADISANALSMATKNLEQISKQCGKELNATFLESDLFSNINKTFDMIVSNPPYIASAVIDTLEPEVRLYEPLHALDGAEDGLFFYRKIIAESRFHLKKSGVLLFEIGHDQGEAVSMLMQENGFASVYVKKDYAGLDRVVVGFLGEEE